MHNQLFPAEITEFSAETLIKTHSHKSRIIYWILLVSFTALIASLFFITVDVNVQSRGIITTNERTTSVVIPVYGKIQSLYIAENSYVNKGDTLAVIDTTEISRNLQLTNEKAEQLHSFILDLEILTTSPLSQKLKLATPKYTKELQRHFSELRFQQSEIDILRKEYTRQQTLYKQTVISTAEYEQAAYQYENASLRYQQMQSAQLSVWQNELENNKTQLISLHQSRIELQRELQKYILTASFTGYIQGLSGIEEGSVVFSGQEIATLTPDARLIAETYITTSDIGMIYPQQQLKVRIDAYEANTWGFVEGTVEEIANDITIANGQVHGFRLVCALHSDSLQYQHKTVKIKKGMSFTANFILQQRTLAQLLYDKVSDWINPNVIKRENF